MLDNLVDNLCITSYNSTGFGIPAQNYIRTLLLFTDILCIQEHFLLDSQDKKYSNTKKLVKQFGASHDMFIVPAHKDNTQVSRGRGKGGLVTIWKKGLTRYVSKVECSNFRIQATKFEFPSKNILLINAYFPCDPRTDSFDETELLTLLADITVVVETSLCSNVMIAADLN